MVEVIAANEGAKKEAEKQLQAIVDESLVPGLSGPEYRGHIPEYSQAILRLRRDIRRGRYTPEQLWGKDGKDGEHPDFEIVPAKDAREHDFMFAHRVHPFLAKHTSEGRKVGWVVPVGPMGQYGVLKDMMNVEAAAHTPGRIDTRNLFVVPMDEWSGPNGRIVSRREYPYMTTFSQDLGEQFFDLLEGDAKIPKENISTAAGKGLHQYIPLIKDLIAQQAAFEVNGGLGKNGHISFSESTYGVRLKRKLAELVYAIIGAPLTTQTMDQNETTSSGGMPVPAFANTTYIGLWKMLLDYEAANKGKGLVEATFGMDNDNEELKWQNEVGQRFAAAYLEPHLTKPDPSFPGTYVHQFPGRAIMVRCLLDSVGEVRKSK